ncbi:MAG TPA: SIS domain-containing protein [Clostridiaceae bacterium]|nr:SIS domain-containing protein [Clostridiaceae bacterium]
MNEKLRNIGNHYLASGGGNTICEIFQQPEMWIKTAEIVASQHDQIRKFIEIITREPDHIIILTGAGSSDYVGRASHVSLNPFFHHRIRSVSTTDIVASPRDLLSPNRPTLLVSFARSGNSPESVATIEAADSICEKVRHLVITCNSEGHLAKLGKSRTDFYSIILPAETNDKGFAMTSSFTCMYLAALLAFSSRDSLEVMLNNLQAVSMATIRVLNDFEEIERIVSDYFFERIVYLGSGVLKGIANESALKMLELTRGKVATLSDSALGFRHGPKSFLNDKTLIILYLSADLSTYRYEMDLLKELSAERRGNKIVAVTNHSAPDLEKYVDFLINAELPMVNSHMIALVNVVIAQLLAFFKSLKLGLAPDNPFPDGEVNRVVKGVTIYPI